MENDNVECIEAKENLNEYNLKELQLEAKRFGVNNFEKLNKEQIVKKILERSTEMGLIKL